MKIVSSLSKQTTLFLISLITLSTLFLPLTSLNAAAISNGMDAAYVLGEPDFESVTFVGGAGDLIIPFSTSYDSVNERLFVLDALPFLGANRILVYDLSGGVTNGMNASNVFGQSDFASMASGTTAGLLSGLVYDLEYDSDNERLFVSDTGNHRVLVYDLSGGITDGMDASFVLGQADFTSGSELFASTTNAVGNPSGLAYDSNNDYLYVGNLGYARVQVFDLSGGISNNMNMSYVLGQEDFGSTGGNLDIDGMQSPQLMDYDEVNDRLFLTSDTQHRTLVYDMSGGVTNGMDASYVIGQEDFVSNSSVLDIDGAIGSLGVTYDSDNDLLFVGNVGASRVMVYDLANISNGMDATYVLGQSDFTSGATGTTASLFNEPAGMSFDTTNNYLFVADSLNSRLLIFNLSNSNSQNSNNNGLNYTHPPHCQADITPSTITQGEEANLSWSMSWPTHRKGTYYTKVPGRGLFSHKVSSVTIQPESSTTYRLAIFNLWGANFCEAEVTVLDENGEELTSTNNSTLTASAVSSKFFRPIVSFFASIFVR